MNDALDDQRRSEPRSETKKKHPSGPVTSDRLHGRVIYNLHRPAECSLKIELNPARPQITRIPQRTAVENRARITNRDNVVVPIRNGLPDSRHHQLGRQERPRDHLPGLALPGDKELDVVAADVGDEDLRDSRTCAQLFYGGRLLIRGIKNCHRRHDAITPIRTFQDLANDFIPSSCRLAAKLSMPMSSLRKFGPFFLAVA